MFQKGRLDLLEKISRQQSKSAASSALSTTFPTDKDTTTSPAASSLLDTKNGASLDRLSQGQKTSFYQIKELERRVDFFERELANCFHVVELQARLIKDLLFILPNDGMLICTCTYILHVLILLASYTPKTVRSHPEIVSLLNELKWNAPAVSNFGKYGKIPLMQSFTPASKFSPYNSVVSSQMQQQQQLTQKQHDINQQQQQLNHQQEQLNTQISSQSSIQQQHQHIPAQQSRDTHDWWTKSLGQTSTDAYTSQPLHLFNNHDTEHVIGSPWNATTAPPFSTESAISSLQYLPPPASSAVSVAGLPSVRVPES